LLHQIKCNKGQATQCESDPVQTETAPVEAVSVEACIPCALGHDWKLAPRLPLQGAAGRCQARHPAVSGSHSAVSSGAQCHHREGSCHPQV